MSTLALSMPATAQEVNDLQPLVNALGKGSFSDKSKAISRLADHSDPRVADILSEMMVGHISILKSNGQAVIIKENSTNLEAFDILSGATLGVVAPSNLNKITINNRLRRDLAGVIGQLTLMHKDKAIRKKAAETMLQSRDVANMALLDKAIKSEKDISVLTTLQQAKAVITLMTNAPIKDKQSAINIVSTIAPRDALILLSPYAQSDGPLYKTSKAAIKKINDKLKWQNVGQTIIYGLSLGSILLLAAIGLAITFGVMGVINMAHGEMVMIGAYTTFVVQSLVNHFMPALQTWSLLIALPIAFIVAGCIGILLERTVIRWLYGRKLETLLATWGVSLILQQAVRTVFGASNREVSNPWWMSGSFEFWGMGITASRLWIIFFSLAVFVFLLVLMKKTFFGLQVRAVTQNHTMANAMGIRTPWIDALTFGLGSGIAGLAGVALSQIDNVSPNLGQGYIIDSFMVVVFGGVGNLWGALVAALTLGLANKLLEPWVGSVLAKILLLIFIILFIQKRPRGLFAQKGRAVEV